MRILLDNCVHRKFKAILPGHAVRHASEAGLHRLRNSELLKQAAKSHEVIVTADKNIRHQQHLETLPLAVLELNTNYTRLVDLEVLKPFMESALALTERCRFVSVNSDGSTETIAPR